jgi:hypothetical protein
MKNIVIVFAFFMVLVSCGEQEFKLSSEELRQKAISAAGDNNQIITSAEEIIDITAEVLFDEGIAQGRSFSGRGMGRSCDPSIEHSYLIDRTHYDTILYVGTMTIDYGNGESCIDGETRKGKVIDNFLYVLNTEMEVFASKETITFENYVKDTVNIDGTMVIQSKSDEPVTLQTDQAKITYQDGTSAIWKGLLSFASTNPDPQTGKADTKIISGSMEGITRRKETFTTTITTPIEYNYSCLNTIVPIRGTVSMNVNNIPTTIEYGNGNCDSIYIISTEDNTIGAQF